MNRKKLPNRRPSATIRVDWDHKFYVTVGYDITNGDIREVFYSDGMKTGTDLFHMAQDSCVLLSLLLQHGVGLDEISKSLSGNSLIVALIGALRE